MKGYAAWLKGLPAKPVYVTYPANFGFTFVFCDPLHGREPLLKLGVKTCVITRRKTAYCESKKRNMPKR